MVAPAPSLSMASVSGTAATLRPAATLPPSQAGAAKPAASFASTLESALDAVSRAQGEATALQRQYQAGVAGVSLEETMVAMQKAQVGFQATLAVRNRLVSAYSDIMNMQV